MAYQREPANLPPLCDPQLLPADPLKATILQLSGWGIEWRCDCGRSGVYPLRLLCARLHPQRPTIEAVAGRLKCDREGCGKRPRELALTDARGGHPLQGYAPQRFQIKGSC